VEGERLTKHKERFKQGIGRKFSRTLRHLSTLKRMMAITHKQLKGEGQNYSTYKGLPYLAHLERKREVTIRFKRVLMFLLRLNSTEVDLLKKKKCRGLRGVKKKENLEREGGGGGVPFRFDSD